MKKRIFLFLAIIALPVAAWAQSTNAPTAWLTIPSFSIPLPASIAAWIAAHGIVLWLGMRAAIKILDGFQTGRPWVAQIVSVLENVSLNKTVAPIAQKVAGEDVVQQPTPNGLPQGKAIEQPTPNGLQ